MYFDKKTFPKGTKKTGRVRRSRVRLEFRLVALSNAQSSHHRISAFNKWEEERAC